LARKFSEAGHHVIVVGRTLEKLEGLVSEIREKGGSAGSVVADVTSEVDQEKIVEAVRARKEPLAAAIYNAGSNFPIKFSDVTPEQFEEFWRIGCFGAFLTARHALPLFSEQGKGSLFLLERRPRCEVALILRISQSPRQDFETLLRPWHANTGRRVFTSLTW
jgi:NAD(P)-dependent dehydrogenase (short-subunit alcohol dehydrogenase family)